MAYAPTPWGYDVDGTLPPLITEQQFCDIKGSKWEDDERLASAIESASASIRNACGWHIAPSMPCRVTLDGDGGRNVFLPTNHLTGIESVEVGGAPTEDYQWSRLGQVRLSRPLPCDLQAATVEYVAGYDATTLPDLAEAVAAVVVHRIALSYGVTSETAGGVSVSYAQSAAYGGATASLTDSERAAIAPYRVVRSHAS